MGISSVKLERIRILGTSFVNVNRSSACDILENEIRNKNRFVYSAVKDVSLTVRSREDAFLRSFYAGCDYIFVDGRGLLYASYLLGKPLRQMVGGPGLYNMMLERAQKKGYRIYLLGGTDDTLSKAIENIKERLPKINIVGWHNGYFCLKESKNIAEKVNSINPDILFLGFSTPKRERFISASREYFNNMLCIPVGGVFDNEAGKTKYAPKIIAILGLEWLYRAIQEPNRLLKRYLLTHSKFVWYFIKELVKNKL